MPATKITINPDLANERRKCTFDVEELARYWLGDQAKLDEKRARGNIFFCLLISNIRRFVHDVREEEKAGDERGEGHGMTYQLRMK